MSPIASFSLPLAALLGPAAMLLVLAAAATDLHARRIPNWLTFGAWAMALPLQLALHGWAAGTLTWTGGWLTGLAMMLPFYLLRGMAAGDVKLMAAVGAWLGAMMAFEIALATFLLGGIAAIATAWRQRRLGQLRRNLGLLLASSGWWRVTAAPTAEPVPWHSVGTLPYGVAIAAGTIVVLFASA